MVPRYLVPTLWPQIEAWTTRALRGFGIFSAEATKARLESGEWDLWVATRGQTVTAFGIAQVWDADVCRVLSIHVSGGDLADHNAMWPVIKAHAKARGCAKIISDPRRGWFRAGKLPADWRHVADVAVAEVA